MWMSLFPGLLLSMQEVQTSIGIIVGSVTRQAKYLGVDGEYSLSETDVSTALLRFP